MLERNGSKSFEFTIPADVVRGSISASVKDYPTPLASMTDALQSLLRQPNGCFEQTSPTSYPITMAQQYFLTHTGVDPAIIEKARGLLEDSYKKLTGFETRTKGYEWFGADPGHEALTAYGLMQFTDMAEVRAVDKDMLDRTRAWLLSRRDGKGGFSRNSRALDSFGGAPADTTHAYIVWALIESGQKDLAKEIAHVKEGIRAFCGFPQKRQFPQATSIEARPERPHRIFPFLLLFSFFSVCANFHRKILRQDGL